MYCFYRNEEPHNYLIKFQIYELSYPLFHQFFGVNYVHLDEKNEFVIFKSFPPLLI